MVKKFFMVASMSGMVFLTACFAPNIRLFESASDPLQEFVLQGSALEKVALLQINGVISDAGEEGMLQSKPGMVQDFVSQLNLAENDPYVQAIVVKINSPGGTITASDILYHELVAFKKRSNKKIVMMMMDVAASGGYYIALPADYIIAHPTTVTGSIGAVFMTPDVTALMGKIGLEMNVKKSGRNKDIGSPYRKATEEEREILQHLIDNMGQMFVDKVVTHRHLSAENRKKVATARIFLARDALAIGLIDKIGYLEDAFGKVRELADLPDDSKIVVYRKSFHANDTYYNTSTKLSQGKLVDLGLPGSLASIRSGFYFLWTPGLKSE